MRKIILQEVALQAIRFTAQPRSGTMSVYGGLRDQVSQVCRAD